MNNIIIGWYSQRRTFLILFTIVFGIFVCGKSVASHQTSDYTSSKFSIRVFNANTGGNLIVLLSGDGGNTVSNIKLAEALAKKDTTVLLINSRKYFWAKKKPDQFVSDLEELIMEYMNKEKKTFFSVAGYSFGADVVSFVPARLSSQANKKLKNILLFSPSETTDFVIKVADMLPIFSKQREYSVTEEILRHGHKIVCIIGGDKNAYQRLSNSNAKLLQLSGGHNFNNDFERVILELRKITN